MALFDLHGRWFDNYSQEVTIVMKGTSEFDVEPVSASIRPAWHRAQGHVSDSGKVRAVFTGTHPDLEVQGFVAADGQTITWSNGGYWRRLAP